MDGIKYTVFTDKIIRLLGKNQYTFNVKSGSTTTEIKHWVELFFGVKVIAMNSHRLPGKGRRMGHIMGHRMHYRKELKSQYLIAWQYIYTKLLSRVQAMEP